MDYWSFKYPGVAARKENLAQWIYLALKRAFTCENIQCGFCTCGMWPINSDTMANQMDPSEVYQPIVDDIASILIGLQIEEIQIDVEAPPNPGTLHYFVEKVGEVGGQEFEGATNVPNADIVDITRAAPGGASQLQSLTQFLSLPLVTTTKHSTRTKAHIDFSRFYILTSEKYIQGVEERIEPKEEVENAKHQRRMNIRPRGRGEKKKRHVKWTQSNCMKKNVLERRPSR